MEERVSQLELTVAELEDSLVKDYGLIRRCRVPTFEHGVASCNHLGKLTIMILENSGARVLCFVDLTPGKVCKALCNAGWIQTPGIYCLPSLTVVIISPALQGGRRPGVRRAVTGIWT